MDLKTLYHYYETGVGPFRSLSNLSEEEAERIQAGLRERGDVFASQRPPEYLAARRAVEMQVRQLFIEKRGCPERQTPHYMILGPAVWVRGWYREPGLVAVPLDQFHPTAISFTYGDSYPAMRFQDGKAYRGQVYTLEELPGLIELYGLPQVWNPDGRFGPERYIEAQVWEDGPLASYLAG